MKTILFTLIAGICLALPAQAQSIKQKKAVTKVITQFAKSGDSQDADKLETLLDANYRVVMNQLFGSDEAFVLDKNAYLQKIRDKEFGGDTRALTIEDLAINGKSATARVTFAGSKLTMVSFLQLIQDKNGQWKLLQDVPTVI